MASRKKKRFRKKGKTLDSSRRRNLTVRAEASRKGRDSEGSFGRKVARKEGLPASTRAGTKEKSECFQKKEKKDSAAGRESWPVEEGGKIEELSSNKHGWARTLGKLLVQGEIREGMPENQGGVDRLRKREDP